MAELSSSPEVDQPSKIIKIRHYKRKVPKVDGIIVSATTPPKRVTKKKNNKKSVTVPFSVIGIVKVLRKLADKIEKNAC